MNAWPQPLARQPPPPVHLLCLLIHKQKHFVPLICYACWSTSRPHALCLCFMHHRPRCKLCGASIAGIFHPLRLLSVLSSAASRTCWRCCCSLLLLCMCHTFHVCITVGARALLRLGAPASLLPSVGLGPPPPHLLSVSDWNPIVICIGQRHAVARAPSWRRLWGCVVGDGEQGGGAEGQGGHRVCDRQSSEANTCVQAVLPFCTCLQ